MPTDILDTYEILSTLHQTAATAVYLIRHKKLKEIRILKSAKRDDRNSSDILSEASLLSGYHFAGIPTIFDFYTDETTDYLVEQFIQGISLSELMLRRVLDLDETLDILIKLCDILNHLHTYGAKPVVYRDLKPEHVFLYNENVWLVDYGIAVEEGKSCEPKGTKGFAAPEQIRGEPPCRANDIYSLGCLLMKMTEQISEKDKRFVNEIVSRSTAENITDRYSSVALMKSELCKKKNRINCKKNKEEHLVNSVAVVGAAGGVGCTHFAIALTVYLNSKGIRTYYVDRSEKRVLQTLAENRPELRQKDGIIYHGNFYGWLEYGPAVEELPPPKGLYVIDYGTSKLLNDSVDEIIMVFSGAPWKNDTDFGINYKDTDCICVAQMISRADALRLARKYRKKIYSFPFFQNPFYPDKNSEKVLRKIKTLIRENT